MLNIFHIVLTQPLLNILVWLYNVIPGQDLGWSIVVLTILIRLVLFPSFQKSLKAQKELQQLQPKLEEIKQKHKGDKEAEAKATLDFYKENKINPLSSCLPLLIQLPILIALYSVYRSGLGNQVADQLYSFISDPGKINTNFLGIFDLTRPNYGFALAAGVLQYIQTKMISTRTGIKTTDSTAKIMNFQINYFMPLVTILIAWSLPAGLSLYWVISTLFAIGQQFYIMRSNKN